MWQIKFCHSQQLTSNTYLSYHSNVCRVEKMGGKNTVEHVGLVAKHLRVANIALDIISVINYSSFYILRTNAHHKLQKKNKGLSHHGRLWGLENALE